MTTTRVLEIRTYRIRAGACDEFGRRMATALPTLERYGIDVVGMSPSEADDEHYALLRSFHSLEEREVREAAFYSSDDWRNGPRESIIELIESYHTVVVRSTQAAVKALAESLRA
jgi:broad specificity phosphatase PhoE